MGQRRHHYEQAFEQYLRARRIPYISVNEARKALLPDAARLTFTPDTPGAQPRAIKSFDFVVYGERENLLVDIKGRRVAHRPGARPARFESWVTLEDVESLRNWMGLFGAGFDAAFVFVYWCEGQPPDALFQEVFTHHDRWYAVRAVRLGPYVEHMTTRSQRWRTVHLPAGAFDRVSQPFCPSPGDAEAGPVPPDLRPALQPLGAGLSSP